MRWQDGRRSDNVEDRRGQKGGRGLKVGGAAGVVIVLGVVVFGVATGTDVSGLLDALAGPAGSGGATSPADDARAEFISVVLADTEDTWGPIFQARGQTYTPPRLVLFRDRVDSACGMQSAATGPFYCPGDRQAYVDLSFFDELDQRFGAPGDFAQAYVLAHEIGHHVQTLTGVSAQMHALERGRSEAERNELSVRQELQADCYAGVWGHHANRRDLLEAGDVEEGLRAAAAIGDDTLQRGAGRTVTPESFTHGTSAQRTRWFRVGFDSGDMSRCDTLGAAL
ncbi:MAG: zinc metallopeptidase [Sandaracinaceae bacterium]|nr:zinc metallopeptidase [Sandaracinaceae bacterium]